MPTNTTIKQKWFSNLNNGKQYIAYTFNKKPSILDWKHISIAKTKLHDCSYIEQQISSTKEFFLTFKYLIDDAILSEARINFSKHKYTIIFYNWEYGTKII